MARVALKSVQYDVVVVGGGAAGIGAAIGAQDAGARTLLIERYGFLGGAATVSGVLTYCGFWTQSTPPQRAVGGVGARVLRELGALGADVEPVRIGHSGVIVTLLDPEMLKFALDRVLERSGVEGHLHSVVIGAERESASARGNASIECIDIYTSGERRRVTASAFVDASGDAELARVAGAQTRYGDAEGRVQNGTLAMRFGGIDAQADIARTSWGRAVVEAKAHGAGSLSKEIGLVVRLPVSNDVVAFLADEAFDARDAEQISRAERHARVQAWEYLAAIRSLPGHEAAYLASTGPRIGTRESRHIIGQYALASADVLQAARFEDSIALGAWPVELHPGPGQPNVWKRIANDGAYEIPLRSLRSIDTPNLFAAGRTLDADADAFASVRVMGTAFATGQAAGVAAATHASGDSLDAGRIRRTLTAQGAIVSSH